MKKVQDSDKNLENKKTKIEGLFGWVLIPFFGLVVMVIYQIYSWYKTLIMVDGEDFALTVDFLGDSFVYILIFENIFGLIFVLLSSYLIFLFFKKKKIFINLHIFFLVGLVIYTIIDQWLIHTYLGVLDINEENLILYVIKYAIIWIWYLAVSKRVKNTFIN